MSEDKKTAGQTLIIGAGISGLTAALFLAQQGKSIDLWEAAPKAGGLVRPVLFRGLHLDVGSHRVHPEAVQVLTSLGVSWQQKLRRGVLVLQGRHIEYPPSLAGFLCGLGVENSLRFGLSFLTQKSSLQKFQSWEKDRENLSTKDLGFADFVQERAGHAAYEAFYRPYAEKVFGVEASQLSQSVAKKRVSTEAPLSSLLSSFLSPKKYFLYPEGGLSAVLERLLAKLETLNVNIQYNRPLTIEALPSMSQYERVLYGGYPQVLAPQSTLSYRGLYVLYLSFPVAKLSSVDTFYIPEREYCFGRVSEPQNFSESYQKKEETVLCVEIPQAQFGPHEDFVKKLDEVMRQLYKAKIIPKHLYPSEAKQVFLPKVYPLYLRGWPKEWRATMQQICSLGNVFPFGRQGLFLHCNIDHCVQISRDLVSHLEQQKSPTEWVSYASRYLDVRVRD
jgi:UDP-galactopyranose mutase